MDVRVNRALKFHDPPGGLQKESDWPSVAQAPVRFQKDDLVIRMVREQDGLSPVLKGQLNDAIGRLEIFLPSGYL